MTIEEGIQLCEYSAKTNEVLMKRYDDASGYTRSGNAEIRTTDAKTFEKRAEEYRQLAEWLKELRMYRTMIPSASEVFRAVLDAITVNCIWENEYNLTSSRIKKAVENLPSVRPQEPKYCDRNICIKNEYNGIGCDECEVTKSQEPKTGHWIKISPAGIYECSKCGQNVMTSDICAYKFCHGCSAKMVEPQESEGKE